MKLNREQKAMLASYGRSVLSAVAAVIATGNYQPDDLMKAAVAAALPPLLRWANTNDPAFGRGA
jgi:hypothetical protein